MSINLCIGLSVVAILLNTSLQDKVSRNRLPACAPPTISCKAKHRYRSLDGTCNNEKRPWYGMAGSNFLRLLPAAYRGTGQHHLSQSGNPLPNPRNISNIFSEKVGRKSPLVSHMHVMWGQMVAHDLTDTAFLKNKKTTELECNCSNPHPDCDNIPLHIDDIQQVEGGKECLRFSRSKTASAEHCRFAGKQQVNKATSFLDGSAIYGSSVGETRSMREKSGAGELVSGIQSPSNHRPHSFCESNTSCFATGDPRGGENPALLSFHTVWIRYHNNVARRLKEMNPKWNSNKILKVTRNIIASLFQMITYRDYLPPLLGDKWVEYFDLKAITDGFWHGYDPEYYPGTINSFGAAAFRFGHSQIASFFSLVNPHYERARSWVETSSMFTFEPNVTANNCTFGEAIRGLMMDEALKTDTTINDGLRNHLFRNRNDRFGEDLYAANIQRGREHGLPGYNDYRSLCGLQKVKQFEQLSTEIPEAKIALLKKAYQSADDVDLFVGGLAEESVADGVVGPTFACIIAYQFRAIRKGDRYWHESGMALSKAQLQSVRKVTFSKILCDTGEKMTYVMTYPMLLATERKNDLVRCDSLPEFDLAPWSDNYVKYRAKVTTEISEWTVWFPTNARSPWVLDTTTVASHVRKYRKDQICADVLDHEIRRVPHSSFVQIRLKCNPGSIGATNFPMQLSEQHNWSEWVDAKPLTYADGYKVERKDFACKNPVALQTDSSLTGFSLLKADVFEEYSIEEGIVCRHRDQISGNCQSFRARALCSLEDDRNEVITLPLEKTVMESFVGELFAKLCSMLNICIQRDFSKPV